MKKGVLGKGLAALLPVAGTNNQILQIAVNMLRPNPDQPRKRISLEEIKELSESVIEYGILQPIIVCNEGNGKYKIVSGERRWRAAIAAGLKEVPAISKNLTEREIREIAIIENIQREDLKPLEEAEAYSSLITKFNYTQEDLAKRLSKSRSYIANTLRLLKLPASIMAKLDAGEITAGHARAMLASDDPESLIKEVINQNMTVRDVENKVGNKDKVNDNIIKNIKSILSDKSKMDNFSSKIGAKISILNDGKKALFIIFSEDESDTNFIKEKLDYIRNS